MRHSPASDFAFVTVGFNCSNYRQREMSLQQQVQGLALLFKQTLPDTGRFHSTLIRRGRKDEVWMQILPPFCGEAVISQQERKSSWRKGATGKSLPQQMMEREK